MPEVQQLGRFFGHGRSAWDDWQPDFPIRLRLNDAGENQHRLTFFSAPENAVGLLHQKRNLYNLPTINFQVRTGSFREGTGKFCDH